MATQAWSSDPGLRMSAFQGVTLPLRELLSEIEQRGWQPNVALSGQEYVAKAKNPYGETLEATGPDDSTATGHLLLKIMRRETIRGTAKTSSWDTSALHPQIEDIAKEYAKAPVYDPSAAPAWKELADDSSRRADVIKQQLKVEYTPDPEPYESAQEMMEDIAKNKHISISTANSQHPIWTTKQNADFRLVHDVMGHGVSGGNFDWAGELGACGAHFPLLSPNAQKALATECIGQTAAGSYFRSFMPQKVFFPKFIEGIQGKENPLGHQGVHPSQTLVPGQMPQVKPYQQEGLWWSTQVPHEDFQGALPVFGSVDDIPPDPNADWSSGVTPMPGNAFQWQNDPLEAQNVTDNALKVDTGWSKLDESTMKQAIVNAFRVVLLSPRKDLRGNAIHYQDISSVPASVDDPQRYWNTLEERRESWNQARGFAAESHKPYYKEYQEFRRYVRGSNPTLEYWEADEEAQRQFTHMWTEMEDQLLVDPKNENLTTDEIERKVAKAMKIRLKQVTKPDDGKTDFGHGQMRLQADIQLDLQGQEAGKYPAFMGSHLQAIAQVSQHVDQLVNAALEDVHDHDGTGHHFRAATLALGLKGVGPKVASFAWLLLQPATSQLATIDSHMMEALGHDYSKEMNNRDYFKFERELAAGRDAAGYGHVPLGQFQWGMWDNKRTGEGSHQDHSSLKVLNPTPYDQVNWSQKLPVNQDWVPPSWWEETQPARDQVGTQWDNEVAPQFNSESVPRFSKRYPKVGMSIRIPWINWGHQIFVGDPGETFMNLARRKLDFTMEDVWTYMRQGGFSAGSYDPGTGQVFSPEPVSGIQKEQIQAQLQNVAPWKQR